jgi:hypothetical protein
LFAGSNVHTGYLFACLLALASFEC